MRRYFWNIIIAADQFVNALLGGDPDETLSSRSGKRPHVLLWRSLNALLNKIDKGHTARAIEPDEGADASIGSKK